MSEFIQNFHFLRPWWLLALLPLSTLLALNWKNRLSSRSWKSVCDERLLPYVLVGSQHTQSRTPAYLATFVVFVLIVALAGPVWTQRAQPLYRSQSALVVILDLSASMNANDIRPSRVQRAKLKIQDILEKRKEGQTALVVYAQEAFVVSPLTDDTKTISALVSSLGTDIMPTQGSRPLEAVEKSVKLLQQAGSRSGNLLLISDGIGDSDVDAIVNLVNAKGHKMLVMAIGTPSGAPIRQGNRYLKDSNGGIVIAKLDDEPLRQLASRTSGRFSHFVSGDHDIDYLLRPLQAPGSQQVNDSKDSKLKADRWKEEGPWLVLLMLPLAALAFRRGLVAVVLVLMLPLPNTSEAFEWKDLWVNQDQKGMQHYKEEKYRPAAQEFEHEQWRGAAYYKAGDYETALYFFEGDDSPEAFYNKGNALAKLGRIREAIDAYDKTLELQADHVDARYNKEVLQKYLKSNPDEQQQNQENPEQQQSKDKKEQDQSSSQQDQGQQDQSKNNQGDKKQQDQQQNQQQGADQSQDQSQQSRRENGDGEDDEFIKQQAQKDAQEQGEDQQNPGQAGEKQDEAGSENQHLQASKTQKDQEEEGKEEMAIEKVSEAELANRQWLRRVPDDPGGLLRRKFLYESQRQRQGNGARPW